MSIKNFTINNKNITKNITNDNSKITWTNQQISAVLKVLPKCKLDENHKTTLDISTKQLKQLVNSVNKTEEQILEYLDFEFKNRLFLQLPITSLPIPSSEMNSQRLKIQNRLNIKHKDIPKSIKQGSVSENTLSKSLSADQFRACLTQSQSNTIQTPVKFSRKRHSNDFDSTIIEQSPIKRLNSETFNESSSLTFVDKILETINEKPKITFADVVSKNISNNKDIKNFKNKIKTKNNFKDKNKFKPNFKNKNSTQDNSLNKPKERKLLKDMSFEERFKLFENAKGPLFRFEITKKTPLLEANIFLADKLKDLNKVWLKDKIDEKESMKTWQKANKILRTIHRVLKSYHYQKIDLEGLRVENQVRIKRSINKTSRFIEQTTALVKVTKSSNDRKTKNAANAKLRKIVSINKKKFHNVEQILKFNNDKISILRKRLTTVVNSYNKFKIRKKFQIKPSIKSIIDQEPKKYPISNDTITTYLEGLFSYEKPAEPKLISEWIESTKFEKQKVFGELFNEVLFDEILKYSRPFKAAGLNSVYVVIFKKLKSAKNFLISWIKGVLDNRIPLTKTDITGKCFSIFKSGDQNKPENYRFINILNSHYKLLTKYINNLISSHLYKILPFEQFANKAGRDGLLDATLINRTLQKATFENSTQVKQSWIDFSKAFDSINHGSLKLILNHLNFDERLIKLLIDSMKYYSLSLGNSFNDKNNTKNNLKTKKLQTIKLQKGIFQGDSVAPTLFCMTLIPLSYHLNKKPRIELTTNLKLNHILFYDDIKLFASDINTLTEITNLVEVYGLEVGLKTNKKKCAYTTDDPIPIDANNPSILIDYTELKNTYKHLGILENQFGADAKENLDKLKEAVDKALDITLSSPLSVGEMVKCINTCITPKILYCFSHIGDENIRRKVATEFDCFIRAKLNNHKIKLTSLTNSRLYLSRDNLGLGLKNMELELDKINLKNYIHVHFTNLFRGLRDRFTIMHEQFKFLSQKYQLNVILNDTSIQINNEDIDNERTAKYRITHYLDKFSETYWLNHYKKSRQFPITYIEKELITPWSASTDFKPNQFKKIVMFQENLHPALNNAVNPDKNSRCVLVDKDNKRCNRFDNINHILSDCPNNNPNKIIRHDKTLYELVNLISVSKARKFIDFSDLKKTHIFRDIKLEVDQPHKILTTLHHNRPDLIIHTPDLIYVCDLTICNISNLDDAATLKRQRYDLDGSKELIKPIPHNQEIGHANKPNFCKHLRNSQEKPVCFIPLCFANFGEINEKNKNYWYTIFEALKMDCKKSLEKISRRVALESEFMAFKYVNYKHKTSQKATTLDTQPPLQSQGDNSQIMDVDMSTET